MNAVKPQAAHAFRYLRLTAMKVREVHEGITVEPDQAATATAGRDLSPRV